MKNRRSEVHTPVQFLGELLREPLAQLLSVVPVVALLVIIGLSGCSTFSRSREISPEERTMIVSVTNQYLTLLFQGNANALNSLIIWSDYLSNRGELLTKEQVVALGQTLPTRWPAENNPVLQLRVLNIDARGDVARVTLQRTERPDLPKITVDLLWAGRAWLVQHDSIFGRQGLIATSGGGSTKSTARMHGTTGNV